MSTSTTMSWLFCQMMETFVDLITTMTVSSKEEEPPATQDADPYDAHLRSTFVPMSTTGLTEQQTIRQSVQQPTTAPPTVPWPPASGSPINEFNTEGYISCAFPTLFPTGATDFVAPRAHTVTLATTLST